jgi:plastocyanin
LHRPLAVIAMLAVIAVAGCSSAAGPTASVPPDVDILVVAKDYKFDTAVLQMTAGDPTLIHFTNEDSEKHDLAIFPDAASSQAMFDGEEIGRGSIVYDVPAFDAGQYFFKCTIHPVMSGTVQVVP